MNRTDRYRRSVAKLHITDLIREKTELAAWLAETKNPMVRSSIQARAQIVQRELASRVVTCPGCGGERRYSDPPHPPTCGR